MHYVYLTFVSFYLDIINAMYCTKNPKHKITVYYCTVLYTIYHCTLLLLLNYIAFSWTVLY